MNAREKEKPFSPITPSTHAKRYRIRIYAAGQRHPRGGAVQIGTDEILATSACEARATARFLWLHRSGAPANGGRFRVVAELVQ